VGIPGAVAGGLGGQASKRATLPLEITIQDFAPAILKDLDEVTLVLTMRNTGKVAVEIPADEHFDRVVKPGNENQRQMSVLLQLTSQTLPKPLILAVGGSAGSSSVPGSMIALPPGGSMTVRVSGQFLIRDAVSRIAPGVAPASFEAKAVLAVDSLKSDKYSIVGRFEDVVSTNAVTIFWPKEE
jgi:hypothetical protein